MALRLITSKKIVGAKIEGTPYTAETLAATDFDVGAYDVSYTVEIEEYDRKLARGDYSHDVGVSGKRLMNISFKIDLAAGAAAGTAPKYGKYLRACAMREVVAAGGVRYTTDSTQNRVPLTMEVRELQEGAVPKQMVYKMRGAMGTLRGVNSRVGQSVTLEFSFKGAYVAASSVAFASILTPTSFDTTRPPAVLSATVSMFATTHCVGGFTIDTGNQVELFSCPSAASGYEGARVVGADPTMETDPDMLLTEDMNWYNAHITDTTGPITITLSNGMVLHAPAAQLLQHGNPGDREGHTTESLRFRLTRGATGNDQFYIQQGVI